MVIFHSYVNVYQRVTYLKTAADVLENLRNNKDGHVAPANIMVTPPEPKGFFDDGHNLIMHICTTVVYNH
jgi:hypothetical protein